jgi:hypothetical protein
VETYEGAWRRYRKWRAWSAVLHVGVVLVMLTFHEAWRGRISLAWAIVGLVALIVAAVLLGEWPCPRCGKAFFGPLWWYQCVSRRCYRCGLPKWSVGP